MRPASFGLRRGRFAGAWLFAVPRQPQNLAFAGEGKRLLYVVGRGPAFRIATLTRGNPGRAK